MVTGWGSSSNQQHWISSLLCPVVLTQPRPALWGCPGKRARRGGEVRGWHGAGTAYCCPASGGTEEHVTCAVSGQHSYILAQENCSICYPVLNEVLCQLAQTILLSRISSINPNMLTVQNCELSHWDQFLYRVFRRTDKFLKYLFLEALQKSVNAQTHEIQALLARTRHGMNEFRETSALLEAGRFLNASDLWLLIARLSFFLCVFLPLCSLPIMKFYSSCIWQIWYRHRPSH